jgi:hypothetical protein
MLLHERDRGIVEIFTEPSPIMKSYRFERGTSSVSDPDPHEIHNLAYLPSYVN